MAMSTEAQRKVQDELDNVIGPDRLPSFDDLVSLPYTEATLLELMRWAPVLPLSIAHRTMADDEYKEYFIPRGATVLGVIIPSHHHHLETHIVLRCF